MNVQPRAGSHRGSYNYKKREKKSHTRRPVLERQGSKATVGAWEDGGACAVLHPMVHSTVVWLKGGQEEGRRLRWEMTFFDSFLFPAATMAK